MSLDPRKLRHVHTHEHPGRLYALACDSASGLVYAAGNDRAVYTLDPAADEPALERRWNCHENYISCLDICGPALITGSYDRRLVWSRLDTGEQLAAVDAHAGWVRDLVALPDQDLVASVGDDMLVKVWDGAGQLVRTLDGHQKRTPQGYATALYAVAVSPDGKWLASADRLGDVRVWDAGDGKLLQAFSAPTFYTYDAEKRVRSIGGIRGLRFSPAGDRLALSGIGQVSNVDGFVGPCRVELWDWQAGQRVFEGQDKHQAVLNDLQFAPDGEWLLAGGGGDGGGILAVWDLKQPAPLHTVKPKGHVHRVRLDASGDRLFAAGYLGLQVWSFSGEGG